MNLFVPPDKDYYIGKVRGFNPSLSDMPGQNALSSIVTNFLTMVVRTVAFSQILRTRLTPLLKTKEGSAWETNEMHFHYPFSGMHNDTYRYELPNRGVLDLYTYQNSLEALWGENAFPFDLLTAIHPVFGKHKLAHHFNHTGQNPVLGAWCLNYEFCAPESDNRNPVRILENNLNTSAGKRTLEFLTNMRKDPNFQLSEVYRNLMFSLVPFSLKKQLIESNWDVAAMLKKQKSSVEVPPSFNDTVGLLEPFIQQLLLDKKCLLPDEFLANGKAREAGLTPESFALMVLITAIFFGPTNTRFRGSYLKHFHENFGHLRFRAETSGVLTLLAHNLSRDLANVYNPMLGIYSGLIGSGDFSKMSAERLASLDMNMNQGLRTVYDRVVFFINKDEKGFFLDRIDFALPSDMAANPSTPNHIKTKQCLSNVALPQQSFTGKEARKLLTSYLA